MKNPLHFIFESEIYPHARTLRTSVGRKFLDSFNVINGDMSTEEEEPTLGLFDVLTLGIPAALARLDVFITERFNDLLRDDKTNSLELTLFAVGTVINFMFNQAPRFLFSGIVAIVAFLPITLPTHLITILIDNFRDDSMSKAINLKGTGKGGEEKTLKEALTWHNPYNKASGLYNIEELHSEKLDEERVVLYLPDDGGKWSRRDLFIFKYHSNDQGVKALFTHNIGGVAKQCPEQARQIAEQKSDEQTGLKI
ncbi:hypothetical protein [Legionella parisiensis]|uniref:Uncharacterized protein n=1 Tax=Legionella parisiensis TaxID=45071 RepID=A0A1E5JU24_9GAMM|nr:hypothetical protein [Legionella parisiensis]KTD40111.1 hypothetical protein Lpar_1428 [Legionella parisiensis]OEH47568.1 hypothetical protein lpari_01420 [Legionella parisiensis]STX77344.1 Uncharacterised protein [Legionella parisiensis]